MGHCDESVYSLLVTLLVSGQSKNKSDELFDNMIIHYKLLFHLRKG